MNVHLVFPNEYIEALEPVFLENGIFITDKDTNIDTFAQWATSQNECKSDLAFIYGSGNVSTSQSAFSQKQAIYERLREVRIARQTLRLIIIFPKTVEQDRAFISKLVQLGIYDLYFSDEMTVEDILTWFNQSKTLADVQELIGDYCGESEKNIENVQIKQHIEHIGIEDEVEVEQKSRGFSFKMPTMPKYQLKPRKEKVESDNDGRKEEKPKSRKTSNDFKLPSFPLLQRKTTVLQPKTIVVASLHGGAGSTFLIHNFTRFLSKQNIVSSILETSLNSLIWYEIADREGIPLQKFDSWCSQILRNGTIMHSAKIQIENTNVIAFHPKDKIQDLTSEHFRNVIQAARQVPFLFIDLSTDWNNPFAEEAIKNCDEFWIVTRPDPTHLLAQQKQKRSFLNKVVRYVGEDNCIFIGNGWDKGVDEDDFPIDSLINLPYFNDNIQALMKGVPLYQIKGRLFDKQFEKLKNRLIQEVGKVSLYQ